jgi:hypothetical protein
MKTWKLFLWCLIALIVVALVLSQWGSQLEFNFPSMFHNILHVLQNAGVR